MERIKFEENSRERFEERELQPSEGAWAKLEGMLDEVQPEKKKASVAWLAIAASFIGFVIIASVYFNQTGNKERLVIENAPLEILNNKQNKTPFKTVEEIKKQQKAVAENVESEGVFIEKDTESDILNSSVNTKNNVASVSGKTEEPSSITKNNTTVLQKKRESNIPKPTLAIANVSTIASAVSEEKKNTTTIRYDTPTQLLIVDKEPLAIQKKLLAIAVATKNTPTEVTNEEIDALLSMAKRDIKKHYILKLNMVKVDALALLNEVEMEEVTSFRAKVFIVLEDSYDYVKTSVANRND